MLTLSRCDSGDSNFEANGRFLTASILHGEDPVAPAGMAMGLALARGAKQMDRQSSQNSHHDDAESLW